MFEASITAKFGGSSLADAGQFEKVKSIIESDKNRRYIIPSAPGKRFSSDYKITDLLYLCHAHVQQGIPFNDVFEIISNRYKEIVSDLSKKYSYMNDLNIEEYLVAIKNNIQSGASADYTASRGEYLNAIILSKLLKFRFIDSAELVYFNKYGVYDAAKTQEAVAAKLVHINYAVIPGFYGTTHNGNIKTFTRGGSDITGAIIAKCTSSVLYENWTDVSGFMMTDPRIVDNPKPIDVITYRELRELSYMGAGVLHEEAVFPVREVGIPINIKNTNRPKDKGTLIVDDSQKSDNQHAITGIAGKKDFTVIAIEKHLMNIELGFCRKLLSILENNGIPFECMPSGIDSVSLVIEDKKLQDKLEDIIDEINRQCRPDSIDVYPNMALIATVGKGMSRKKGIASQIFTCLSENQVNIRMINQGSSEINVIVGVETEDFDTAIKSIYNRFVY
ncbi:aspartate kinase [Clostridium sp. 19966]|uniref:aspartate kinase n=1 Tax=Clostridium sp. 19966 TaxID=2768166 RepID=UPI0028DE70C0|nr:aspartate kinase [Clostridium sp. 19966]MDT8716307.1 aspartate kinase [Clostridium sp. 19966]